MVRSRFYHWQTEWKAVVSTGRVRGVMCCFANHAPICALTVRWRWLHCSLLSYILKCMSICQTASSNWVPMVFLFSGTLYHQPWPRRKAESCGGVERILEPPKGLSILSFTLALVSPIPIHTDSHGRTFSTRSWSIMDKTQVNFKRENGCTAITVLCDTENRELKPAAEFKQRKGSK